MPPGVQFNVPMFNQFLRGRGWNVTWERALQCPCRSSRTGGADPSCAVCGGVGFIWENPITTVVGMSAMNGTRKYALFSEWEDGDIVCTLPSDSDAYGAGEFDRFTLTDASYRFTTLLVRGKNDTLKYRHVKQIEQVWGIVSGVKTDLVKDIDYQLNDHTIVWLTTTLPAGAQYAVVYEAHPEYFVYRGLVKDRPHDGGLTLPRRVQLRLMELFNRVADQ